MMHILFIVYMISVTQVLSNYIGKHASLKLMKWIVILVVSMQYILNKALYIFFVRVVKRMCNSYNCNQCQEIKAFLSILLMLLLEQK